MQKEKERIVNWIRQWFQENGPNCNAVIGISGGKDSSVVAALCVEALGNNRVIGVLMPNGKQHDIDDAVSLCEFLGISFIQININSAYEGILNQVQDGVLLTPCLSGFTFDALTVSEQTKINLPPRLRMSTLYAISQSLNGRVANTCNLSEDYVGYFTRWGDGVGDFAPLAHLTCTEVCELGKACGLPDELVYKVPADGLCDKTDEDNLGFTYEELDDFIRGRTIANKEVLQRIQTLHRQNQFKMQPVPCLNRLGENLC
jgi:NAD+ synthase